MKKNTIIYTICGVVMVVLLVLVINKAYHDITKFVLQDMSETDIKFNDEKYNIYLFWGNGCPHCEELAIFLDGLDNKYRDCFDIYTFEVWNNKTNNEFKKKMIESIGKDYELAVPYMIIGDKSFVGYNKKMNDELKSAIMGHCGKSDRFDAYQNIQKNIATQADN